MFFDDEFDRLFGRIASSFTAPVLTPDAAIRLERAPTPIYYGYTITVGPDGRPSIKEYGNVRPEHQPQPNARDPLVETIVDDNQKLIKMVAEVPGVEKPDIKIRVEEKAVSIDAERGEKRFHAVVPIQHKVDTNSAKASYKNGILELSFKQLEPEKPKGKTVEVT